MPKRTPLVAWIRLFKTGRRLYYLADLMKLAGSSVATARKAAQRLARQGILHRVGPELYANTLVQGSIEQVVGVLYRPAYVSLESALYRFGVISQAPFLVTCVTTNNTRHVTLPIGDILYQHVKPALFFGFHEEDGVAIADLEKALCDVIYLRRQNGVPVATDEWDLTACDRGTLFHYAAAFPKTVRDAVARLGR